MARRLLLLFFLTACTAPPVFARAGGGGGYSGGGGGFSGGGGGFSSGGGGYSGRSRSNRPMSTAESIIWIIVVIVMMYLKIQGAIGRSGRMERTIAQGVAHAKSEMIKASIDLIKARDPAFEAAAFLDRIKQAFIQIQEAWSNGDMAPARAFISDGVHERFAIYLLMQKTMGLRNKMDQVHVLKADIAHAQTDAHFDTLHISIRAAAVDQDISLEDGSVVRNRLGNPEEFVEVWSFLRRPGVQTRAKPGLIEGFCPNCGSPLKIMDAAKCGACDSWINSGEYDWVLAEITQACEWSIQATADPIPGMAELIQRDPALNVQFLEDRASVMFWRWQLAQWEPNAESLGAVADEAFLESHRKRQALQQVLYRNAAVGGVEVLALEGGLEVDKAHVLVKWSAERFRVHEGKPVCQEAILYHFVFVLARSAQARTETHAGLRSLLCANCGAAPSGRSSAACEFCGTQLNDGSRTWVLTNVLPRGQWRPPTPLIARKEAEPAAGDLAWSGAMPPVQALAVLVGAMILDGRIDPREVEFARAYSNKHGVPPERLSTLMEAARAGRLEVPAPQDAEQGRVFLRGVIQMSLADGLISKPELDTLMAFGAQMRLPAPEVREMISRERTALFNRFKRGGA